MKKNACCCVPGFWLMASLLISVVVSGCASANISTRQPVSQVPRQVAIEIKDQTGGMTYGQANDFREIIGDCLANEGFLVSSAQSGRIPRITGDVLVYEPGNRMLRYVICCGAGKGTLESMWTLRDDAGKIIGRCRIDGSIMAGICGGSFDEVTEKAGEKLALFLHGYRD